MTFVFKDFLHGFVGDALLPNFGGYRALPNPASDGTNRESAQAQRPKNDVSKKFPTIKAFPFRVHATPTGYLPVKKINAQTDKTIPDSWHDLPCWLR